MKRGFCPQIPTRNLGILLKRLLFAKLRNLNVVILGQHLGNSPDKKLFERSRYSKDPFVLHMNVIVPCNKLLERFNTDALELICGSGPLKRFYITQIYCTRSNKSCQKPLKMYGTRDLVAGDIEELRLG